MTLRIMLLGLVASMGIELPSGADVSCWTRSGRDWVAARLVDRSGSGVEADRADVPPTDCRQAEEGIESPGVARGVEASDDIAFEAVAEGMAADFAADLMAMTEDGPSSEESPSSLAQTEASGANPPEAEELASLALPMIEVDAVGEEDPASEAIAETEEVPSRADRVSSAVRLTREAVQAWVSLVQDPHEDACPAH